MNLSAQSGPKVQIMHQKTPVQVQATLIRWKMCETTTKIIGKM